MSEPQRPEPQTEAGRELLSLSESPNAEELETWVLRIEAEASVIDRQTGERHYVGDDCLPDGHGCPCAHHRASRAPRFVGPIQ